MHFQSIYEGRANKKRILILPLAILWASISLAGGVIIDGIPYADTIEIKCHVKKAVPAPEKGSTWYTSSSIGDVWLKFDPSTQPTATITHGVIRIFKTSPVYSDLVVYERAWIIQYDEEIEGGGDRLLTLDSDSTENPLFFNIDKVERQGLFNSKDGKPKYFLSGMQHTSCIRTIRGGAAGRFQATARKKWK